MTIDAITPGARVLCAVSGGVDSMYLLHRMTELAAQRGFTVGCAHFNHGLRGAESDRDEAFVRTQCAHLGVPFYAGRGDVASVRGMGTEGAARQLRYAFLTDCAAAHGYDWIATAHTADDNAETLLLNLARGCGLRGLTGIPPQRGKLLRPMLDTTRAEAEAYLAAHGIAHVEDSTNASDAYARNRVRHHAVPALESVNAAFVQHAADTAALLREDERFLGGLAAEFLAGQTPAEGIPTAELLALPRPVRVRVLQQAAGRELSRRHLLALEQLCGEEGLGYADMPGLRVTREQGRLFFGAQRRPPLGTYALIPGQQHVYRAGQLHALRRQTTVRHQRKGRVRSGSTFPLPFNPHIDPVPPKTAVPCRLLLLPPGRTSPTLPVLPFPPVPLQLRSPARRAPRSPR